MKQLWTYGLIVCNALIPSCVMVIFLWPMAQNTGWQNYWCDDRYLYDHAATMFATHGLLGDDPREMDAVRDRMPLYPLLLLELRQFEHWSGIPVPAWAILINTLALAASACLVFQILWLTTRSFALALIPALLWPWLPGILPYTLVQLPEAVSTFFCMLASYWLLTTSACGKRTFGAGAALGIATLFKPVFCYFSIPCLILLALQSRRQIRAMIPLLLFFTLAFLIPISLWMARNYHLWGVITLTPNGSAHLANARDAMASDLGLIPIRLESPGIDSSNLPARSAYRSELAWQELRNRLSECAWLACKSLIKLHGSTGVGTLATMASGAKAVVVQDQQPEPRQSPHWSSGWQTLHIIFMAVLVATYGLAICGVFFLLRELQNRLILLWALLIIGYFVLISIPFGNTRYRYPAMPGYAVLAGAGIVSLWNRWRPNKP